VTVFVVGAERDELAIVAAVDRDGDRAAVGEGLADLGERAGRDEGGRAFGRRAARIPVDVADGHAVAVGRDERQAVVADLELHPGDDRGDVVARRRDGDLGDRGREVLGGEHAGALGDLGKRRVLLDGHRPEGELRGTALHGDLAVDGGELDGRVREPARDVGEQPTGDERAAGLVDVRRDLGARRHLVVEGAQHEGAVGGLEEDAAEDGLGRALREQLDRERHGFAEDVPIDLELHETALLARADGRIPVGQDVTSILAQGRAGGFGPLCCRTSSSEESSSSS